MYISVIIVVLFFIILYFTKNNIYESLNVGETEAEAIDEITKQENTLINTLLRKRDIDYTIKFPHKEAAENARLRRELDEKNQEKQLKENFINYEIVVPNYNNSRNNIYNRWYDANEKQIFTQSKDINYLIDISESNNQGYYNPNLGRTFPKKDDIHVSIESEEEEDNNLATNNVPINIPCKYNLCTNFSDNTLNQKYCKYINTCTISNKRLKKEQKWSITPDGVYPVSSEEEGE